MKHSNRRVNWLEYTPAYTTSKHTTYQYTTTQSTHQLYTSNIQSSSTPTKHHKSQR